MNTENEMVAAFQAENEALRIKIQALYHKIEALELLNANVVHLKDVKAFLEGEESANGISIKRGPGRPPSAAPKPVAAAMPRPYAQNAVEHTYEVEAEEPMDDHMETETETDDNSAEEPKVKYSKITGKPLKKRGRKPKPKADEFSKLEEPLDRELKTIFAAQPFNRATYRAVSGILLCLLANRTATVSDLTNFVGGSRVTIVRHTSSLKSAGLLEYQGSRKKGHYALTQGGIDLFNKIRSEVNI